MTDCGWGLAVAVMSLLLAGPAVAGPKYKVLHEFGGRQDGAGVWDSLVFDQKGSLYGTTSGGGAGEYGTVFELAPDKSGNWTETVLYSFRDPFRTNDGGIPFGGVILDSHGNVYGTTQFGGPYGHGTVFELTHGAEVWTENILYNFCPHSGCQDGGSPWAGLTWDRKGNLYGTAGVVFELSPASGGWHEKVIHRFTKPKDGGGPYAGLILDVAGNLYGTTEGGGAHLYGTVYEVRHTSSGWKEQVLHSFPSFRGDGRTPGVGALIMDGSGAIYGTTAGGGCCGGVVFRLTPGSGGRWKETILYEFQGGAAGFEPGAGVVMDHAGNLYGTTIAGGSTQCSCGVVYKLAPRAKGKWNYTVLHVFTGYDGAQPDANLILDSQGNLYGTTATGGVYGGGVVFEITP